MKESLPALSYRQEVLAQFVKSDKGVFETVDNCLDKRKCKCNCAPVIGCDLAKKKDFTVVISLCPECLTVRDFKRSNHIPWPEQQQSITSFYKKQRARVIYIDLTGIGDVVVDNIEKDMMKLVPITFTNSTKCKMVSDLIVNIEQGKLRWDDDKWPQIKEELMILERTLTKTSVSYAAAQGGFDDCVFSLALALKGALECYEYKIVSLGGDSGVEDGDDEEDIEDGFVEVGSSWWQN
jgi:hypothetical protein